jgi:hypothetical protein
MRSLSRDTNGLFRRCWNAMRLLLLLAVVVAAGCTKPNPASCADGHCSDPARPFCDVDGTIGGEANTCISVGCTPNEFVECRQDSALTCNAAGTNYDLLQCEFGCGETGCKDPPPCTTPECEKHIIPKYLPTICNTLAAEPSLDITTNTQLNTGSVNCTKLVAQTGAPEICVMHYQTITIGSTPTTEYHAYGPRVLALVADYELLVKGVLDIGATAGQGPGATVQQANVASSNAGYGGVGNQTPGGAGATISTNGGGGNGGAAVASPDTSTLLVAGMLSGASAKGGGGATLISCRGKVTIEGIIDANGGGGTSGYTDPIGGTYSQARGGGSGGNVIIQGMAIDISGKMFANGGGGGGGGGTLNAQDGSPGTRSTAGGGVGGAGDDGAQGGRGASGLAGATSGTKGSGGGGGGGGGTGWFLTYTPAGVTPNVAFIPAPEFSPPLEPNHTIQTN